MPITRNVTLSSVLVTFTLDVPSMTARCLFQNFIDGNAGSTSEFTVSGADLGAIMAATPVPGKSRADDITEAVYGYAVSKGYIVGEIV